MWLLLRGDIQGYVLFIGLAFEKYNRLCALKLSKHFRRCRSRKKTFPASARQVCRVYAILCKVMAVIRSVWGISGKSPLNNRLKMQSLGTEVLSHPNIPIQMWAKPNLLGWNEGMRFYRAGGSSSEPVNIPYTHTITLLIVFLCFFLSHQNCLIILTSKNEQRGF